MLAWVVWLRIEALGIARLCGSSSAQVTLWQYSITISQIHLAFPKEGLCFRDSPTHSCPPGFVGLMGSCVGTIVIRFAQ